ncbi:MAG: transcription termination factor Rho [Actinomycetota bacterium]|nr:transcription termination factor Rho [Actinomycetota bacterium]
MSEEQQLGRSVLERKERSELQAIAQAMSLDTGPRARKSTLVDQILRATGVEVAEAEPKPRRRAPARASTTATLPLEPEGDRSSENGSAEAKNGSAGSATGAGATADGGSAAPARPARARRARGGGPATAPGDEGLASAPAASQGERGEAVETGAPSTAAGTAGTNGSSPAAQASGSPAAGGAAPGGPASPAPGGAGGTPSGGQQGRADSGRRPHSGGEPGADNGRSSGPSTSGAGGSGSGFGYDSDGGNRRGRRRRRGGDRSERDRSDRELQGSGGEGTFQGEPVQVAGLLDLRDEGFGFLRTNGYLPSPKDVYVSIGQVRRLGLRKGDWVEGASRPAGASEKYPALVQVDTVCGLPAEGARQRPRFEDLTPLFPDSRLNLEVPGDQANMTARIVDLVSPIGKGQRGLIVSPPKAGKTTVMKQIAHSIEANNPQVHLMVLLVDERPEEVTDMRRSVRGEVVASTFDRPAEEHTQVAELAIERARRLVELGMDVVIILDGITRLARAYNLAHPPTGRIMSGGVDSGALYPPKKFFGAARNIEEGGSLTILATALVETGSRMDEVIFEEFKGTGNMELRLDRRLAERRVYPAIDVNSSSTRHEELLFDRSQLQQVWKLRRVLNALGSEGSAAAGLELLMDKIKTTRSNTEFLAEVAKGPGV